MHRIESSWVCLHALMSPLLPHFRQNPFLQKRHDRFNLQTFVRLTSTVDNSPQVNQKKEGIGTKGFPSLGSPCLCRLLRVVIPGQKDSASGAVAHIRARDTGMQKSDSERGVCVHGGAPADGHPTLVSPTHHHCSNSSLLAPVRPPNLRTTTRDDN